MIVIAEIGVNHNGDVSLAKELIDQSAEAGADIVKFQTFKAKTSFRNPPSGRTTRSGTPAPLRASWSSRQSLSWPDEAF